MRGSYRGDSQEAVVLSTQDKGGAMALVPGTYGSGMVQQPASAIQLGRYHLHIGNTSAGLIGINRQYDGDVGANSVVGTDGVWRSDAGDRVRGIAMRSWTSAWPGEDGLFHREAERSGGYALADWIHNSDSLEPSLTLQQASANYRQRHGLHGAIGLPASDGTGPAGRIVSRADGRRPTRTSPSST